MMNDKIPDKYIVNPSDYEKDNSNEFDDFANEGSCVYLVKNKKTNEKFIRKDFIGIENNGNAANDDSYDYSNEEEDLQTNTLEYFDREVKYLYQAQIKGMPFLQFVGYYKPENKNTEDEDKTKEKNKNDDDDDQPYPFIITKFMKGKTLSYLIEDKFQNCSDPNTTKMKIFYGIAFALKYMHNKMKVIHRDIKPANIFLDENNEPYLGDFGYARLIDENLKFTNLGTAFYKAPEIFSGEVIDLSEDDKYKIDTFSFAVTILETISLNLKIKDEKNKEHIISPVNKDYDNYDCDISEYISNGKRYIIDDDFPENYKDLIEVCWSQDPSERFSLDHIVEMMENHQLDLPDYNENNFKEYVEKLKNAENPNLKKKETKKYSKKKYKPKVTYQ